jgi:hypothetical protein
MSGDASEDSATGREAAAERAAGRAVADSRPGWELLARTVREQAPHLTGPRPGGRGLCVTCKGPVSPGTVRCYQCGLHAETLPGLLADVVVPISHAAKGGQHARNLWLYKSARPGAAQARAALRALLVVFLREHGPCTWRSAGMTRPTHLAVVPSGRGRGAPHPLQALVAPCLALPWARLGPGRRDDPAARDLGADRFQAAGVAGADVALLDDTWTSGASAQSACAALRLAGARSVAVIVLGRHVSAPGPGGAGAGRWPGLAAAMPFRPGLCAVHGALGPADAAAGRTREGAFGPWPRGRGMTCD